MKTLKSISILVTLLALASFKQSVPDKKIIVNVIGFKNTNGNCLICLFNKADGFPSKNALKCQPTPIVGSVAKLTIENMKAGTYAIAIVHDENKNGTLDENFFGIPKEGYGASNNVLPKMSSPSFEENKFIVADSDKIITIKLKY